MVEQKYNKNFLRKICISLATLLGLGFVPFLGGTVGSLAGVLLFLVLGNTFFFFITTMVILLLSFPISSFAETIFQKKDASEIIIDDFSGMLISLLFIPHQPKFITLAFILFRMFDFLKVFPANRIEKMKGGIGIVGDDVVAGIYTNLILQFLRYILKISS